VEIVATILFKEILSTLFNLGLILLAFQFGLWLVARCQLRMMP